MWRDLYIAEKVREWEIGRHEYLIDHPLPKTEPMVWPLIRALGKGLRTVGEGLESWGSNPGEPEQCESTS